jgi:phosphoglycolate phosphatase
MIEAVVIDVDDTLCMTEEACFALENETLQHIGQPPMSREIHQSTWGKSMYDIMPTRSPGIDMAAYRQAYAPLFDEFVTSGRLDSVPPENYEAMDELHAAGRALIILTRRTHSEMHHLLDMEHPLADRIDTFYYQETLEHQKPDPRVFDQMLSANDLRPEQCVYVGDKLDDALAANGAGIHFVASLESGLTLPADFSTVKVDRFINKFPEIVAVVAELDSASNMQATA